MVMECKVTACKSHYPKDVPFEVPKGWEWLRGNDIFLPMESISPQGDFFDYIDIESIDNKRNIVSSPKHLPVKDAPSRATRLVRKGDVLFSMVRPYLRNIARVESNGFIASTGFYVCRCSCAIDSEYCLYLMLSEYVVDGLNQFMKGDNSPSINNSHITSWIYPIPPIAEQRRICEKIDSLFSLTDSLDREQALLQNAVGLCRRTVLDLAIRGKLVPQNPSEEPAIELLRRINPAFKASDNLHYGEKLPSGWTCGLFGDLNQHRNKSEDPLASPEDEYELYSVPIYDTGMPEFLNGNEIGSTKQVVDKGDVLLCKINPHLNRSWVVSHYRPELKCIASSEWLVFSSAAILPDYARLFFMSPGFKRLMQSNVSGVGGSLMRARASAVNSYPIWVPPINEQYRIVQAVHQFNATIELMASNL